MPLPNEHSCRLRDPDDFQSDSFRRTSRKSDGKRYDVIMGRLKGENTMTEQGYRYPKDTWTASEARKHCREHDGILFEPASDEEGKTDSDDCCGDAVNDASLIEAKQGQIVQIYESGMKYSHVLQAFIETPWAILHHKLAILEEIVARHISGEKLSAEEVQTRLHGAIRPSNRQIEKVAILPLFGTIFPRANMMTDVSGATSAEIFGKQFDGLVKDPDIGAIVLDVDSPGGHVAGIDELSQKIYDARGKKPIVAIANHLMASAAYWIGTSAEEVVVSPSAEVGSIGVFAVHEDVSVAYEREGIKISLISEGKYKVEGNQYEPLTAEARAAIQVRVSEAYEAFINAVGRNRGVKPDFVRNDFGQGRVVSARQAVELGMADRVGTLEETIDLLLKTAPVLTQKEREEAEDLRLKVNSILRKEK